MALLPDFPDLAILALRLFLGAVLIAHGYPKLFKASMRSQAIEGMKAMGVPRALVLIAALIEVLGGLGLVFGFLTQFAALFIVLEMAGTTLLRRSKMGHKFIGGYELDVAYLVIALALLFSGAGAFSLDAVLGWA